MSSASDSDADAEYPVEKILDRRCVRNVDFYKLLWSGGEVSWQPRKNLNCLDKLIEFFDRQHKRRGRGRKAAINADVDEETESEGEAPYNTNESELGNLFSSCGVVTNVRTVYDRETNRPKGFGFCEFQDQESAQNAINNMDGVELNEVAGQAKRRAPKRKRTEVRTQTREEEWRDFVWITQLHGAIEGIRSRPKEEVDRCLKDLAQLEVVAAQLSIIKARALGALCSSSTRASASAKHPSRALCSSSTRASASVQHPARALCSSSTRASANANQASCLPNQSAMLPLEVLEKELECINREIIMEIKSEQELEEKIDELISQLFCGNENKESDSFPTKLHQCSSVALLHQKQKVTGPDTLWHNQRLKERVTQIARVANELETQRKFVTVARRKRQKIDELFGAIQQLNSQQEEPGQLLNEHKRDFDRQYGENRGKLTMEKGQAKRKEPEKGRLLSAIENENLVAQQGEDWSEFVRCGDQTNPELDGEPFEQAQLSPMQQLPADEQMEQLFAQEGEMEPFPEFIRPLQDVEVAEGGEAAFWCETNLRSIPHTVKWFHNGQELKASDRLEMRAEQQNGIFRLGIKSALKEDIGTYKLLLHNTGAKAQSSAKLGVSVETTNDANKARCEAQQMVEPFPEFIHPLQDAEGAEGEKVVWGLSRKSNPMPIYYAPGGRLHFTLKNGNFWRCAQCVRTQRTAKKNKMNVGPVLVIQVHKDDIYYRKDPRVGHNHLI